MKKFAELTKNEEEHAFELYKNSIVLNCLDASTFDDEYIRIIHNSGLTATAMGIGSGLDAIAARYKLIKDNPDIVIGPVTSVEDIKHAKEEDKVAVILNAQSSSVLFMNTMSSDGLFFQLPNYDLLPIYHKLGLRILMPTYNTRNIFADGCAERTNAGLSLCGIELIEQMNALNILCDSSHMGTQDTLDVCDYATFPVCTHSNARTVCDNARNRSDEEIQAIAEKDGVLGMVTYPSMVKWTKTEAGQRPTIDDLLDHIDHIATLVGVKHVGLGFDFIEGSAGPDDRAKRLRPPNSEDILATRPDIWGKPAPSGYWEYAEDIDDITKTVNIAKGMVARGYSDAEIQGVLGENWMRLFKRAWGK